MGKIFSSIDLGNISEQLFESELFGYEKGAFTDARRDKPGRLEVARGGTLFLDEIGNLSPQMLMKLLTAIEKKQIMRLGSTRTINIDVSLISAINADLEYIDSQRLVQASPALQNQHHRDTSAVAEGARQRYHTTSPIFPRTLFA